MSFEIVANYQQHSNSLPSTASNDKVPAVSGTNYYYPLDILPGEEWTRLTLTTTSQDDGYSNQYFPLGMQWGWKKNGVAFTTSNWWFSTNGRMHFPTPAEFEAGPPTTGGGIYPDSATVGITASPGDLWFDQNIMNTVTPTLLGIASWQGSGSNMGNNGWSALSMSQLAVNYSIATDNVNGYMRFRYIGTGSVHNIRLETIGYFDAGNTYREQQPYLPNQISYYGVSMPRLTGVGQGYSFPLKAYNQNSENGILTNIPYDVSNKVAVTYVGGEPPFNAGGTQSHGVFTYSKSWTESGVVHYLYKVVVYCGRYGSGTFSNVDHSYRITLYKAGASQKFSVSLASDSSNRHPAGAYTGNATNLYWAGPWPHVYENVSLGSNVDWLENIWYSEDNGFSWSKYTGATAATVTFMGSPLGTTPGANNKRILDYNFIFQPWNASAVMFYSSTQSYTGSLTKYYNSQFTPGVAISTALQEMLQYGPWQPLKARVHALFRQTYTPTGSKGGAFSYSDVNSDGTFDQSDVNDALLYLTYGTAIDIDTIAGVNMLRDLLVSDAQNEFYNVTPGDDTIMRQYIEAGYIGANYNRFATSWDAKWILPGVKAVPVAKNNLSTSMFAGLGPIAKDNIVPFTNKSRTRTGEAWNWWTTPSTADLTGGYGALGGSGTTNANY